MGDGAQVQQASDGDNVKLSHKAGGIQFSEAAMARISASVYGDPAKPEAASSSKRNESFPLTLADQPIAPGSVGLKGTYGAPGMPVADVALQPNGHPKVLASTQPYDFGNGSSAPAKPFQPDDYDIYAKVGGNSEDNLPDDAARIIGTAAGAGLSIRKFAPTLTKGFKFDMKPFYEANGVSAHTIDNLSTSRVPAHLFLKSEFTRLRNQAKGLSPDPDMNSDAENELIARVKTVRSLRDQTTAELMEGNNPIKKIDFSELTADTRAQKAFPTVTNFEGAQAKLIAERADTVKDLTTKARAAYDTEKFNAKVGLGLDLGALVGAQAVDGIIDWATPRNRTGWETTVTDFAAPVAVMALSMTSLGKWAPLAKAGIIVGAHTISHLVFDEQYDEKK
jgi:hypothetical protein